MVGESSAAFERFESNFRGVLLVINRWSNYSTYRCIRTVGGYFIAMFNDTWKKTLGSNATDVRKFVGRSPTRFVIYLISNLSLSKPVLKLFCFEFFSYREEKGGFFFIDRFFFLFFFGDRSDSIYFNGASSCSLTIRLRMAFHGIMGHSLWKFSKELSFLEGGKSFRRIYIRDI